MSVSDNHNSNKANSNAGALSLGANTSKATAYSTTPSTRNHTTVRARAARREEGESMATSAQHRQWVRSGSNYKVAYPIAALRDTLRGYGYTVYDMGNTEHLDHIPPEDHTPFSETGWPIKTPYGWVTAGDIMPDGDVPLTLQELGAQLFADVNNGLLPWVKYMNWGPTSNRAAVHDSWQPGHARRTSSDTGHIHISSRSDVTQNAYAPYDPVARWRGIGTAVGRADMIIGLVTGERFVIGPAGPVLITWDEWVTSFTEQKSAWPPVLLLANPERLKDFAPAPAATAAPATLALDTVAVTGRLDFTVGS